MGKVTINPCVDYEISRGRWRRIWTRIEVFVTGFVGGNGSRVVFGYL